VYRRPDKGVFLGHAGGKLSRNTKVGEFDFPVLGQK